MNRTDIINIYAQEINAQSYLEIGVRIADENFNYVNIPHKIGVDPGVEGIFEATYCMTSDEFFKQNNETFDIIFVDGLHEKRQVIRDIENSLSVLSSRGVVICHDLNPKIKEQQLSNDDPLRHKYVAEQKLVGHEEYGFWTGDCWKSFVHFRMTRDDLEMFVIDTDFGVGIIKRGHQKKLDISSELTYEYLDENRNTLLNLRSVEEFLKTAR